MRRGSPFGRLDLNGDGKITREEVLQVFAKIDANGDGAVTREELVDVIHRQGFEDFHQIHRCELEPSGTFYIESVNPSSGEKRHSELLARLDAISSEIASLRAQPES